MAAAALCRLFASRDVDLVAVDNVLVAHLLGRCRNGSHVRAAAGLRGGDAQERLTGGDPGQQLALQVLGTVAGHQVAPAQAKKGVDRQRHGQLGPRHLLHGDVGVDHLLARHGRPAVLLRDGDAEDAHLGHLQQQIVGQIGVAVVNGAGAWGDPGFAELAECLPEEVLLGGKLVVHGASLV
jgi:hypothetical protein